MESSILFRVILIILDALYLDYLCFGDKPGFRIFPVRLWKTFSFSINQMGSEDLPSGHYAHGSKISHRPEEASISPFDTAEEKTRKLEEAARNISLNRQDEQMRIYRYENELNDFQKANKTWKDWIKVLGVIIVLSHLYLIFNAG